MAESKSIFVIVVAAGRGERAGRPEQGPKQYRLIGGKPVLHHTLAALIGSALVDGITVVIHPDDHDLYRQAVAGLDAEKLRAPVDGGATRQLSVLRGLQAIAPDNPDFVLIHDGVRPFIDGRLLASVIEPLLNGAAASLPTLPLTDTIKRGTSDGTVETTVPRAGLFAAQTPQGFKFQSIYEAHRRAASETGTDFTDDSSIAEWAGIDVNIVSGNPDNVKLTVARDIDMADRKLAHPLPDLRVGNGYDVHALMPGDSVTLCGIRIDHDQSLLGHSDADVGFHALTDALLATCGAGDIGDHFPPSDPQWKNAASHIFLTYAARTVTEAGGTIMNVDVTLICEAPKIAPHRDAMRRGLSQLLQIDLERCSIKATTNEAIGFVGRREGIAAIATASVVFGNQKP